MRKTKDILMILYSFVVKNLWLTFYLWNKRAIIKQQYECKQKTIFTEYYDISVYNNYIRVIEQFEDDICMAQNSVDEILYYQLVSQQDFPISNYLSLVRQNRMGCPIIHAVGVKSW